MIISQARRVFADKGYHGAKIEDICKACGIAQGTLYVHFAGKKEVFRGVLYDTLDRIQEMITPLTPERATAIDIENFDLDNFIEERILRILHAVSKNVDIFRILLRESRGLDDEIDQLLKRITRIMLSPIETEIAIGQRLGVLRPQNPHIGAHLPAGTILLFIITNFIESEPPEIEPAAQELSRLILHGLVK